MDRWIICFCFPLILCLWACRNNSAGRMHTEDKPFKPRGDMSDLVYNPVRSDGTIDSSFLPILTLREDVYDFGTILEGDIITRDFHFTNTGTAPLLIRNATSTCGCTVPEWPKTPVPPDSTASIKVIFNSLNKTGEQSKEVTIFANTFPNQTKLTIRGNVAKTN